MGGCLDEPKVRKPKGLQQGLTKTIDATKPAQRLSNDKNPSPLVDVKPKNKFMSINQLLTTYSLQQTLPSCSKMQGPKYISNLIDGSSKVLRIYNIHDIAQKRLEVYTKLIGFQVYQNEQGTLMILDDYCSGQDIYQMIQNVSKNQDKKLFQQKIIDFVNQVYKIITKFHNQNTWLGNLTLSSFRKKSIIDESVRLVDLNLMGETAQPYKMGLAHRNNYQSDYQFFGYLLQFVLLDQSPVFITHKIQYVAISRVKQHQLIQKLLKGIKCDSSYQSRITANDVIVNSQVALGYKFRRDINRLLKMRRKRKAHNRRLYGTDLNDLLVDKRKFSEERIYHYESERIINNISQYIGQLKNIHQQHFINYCNNNETLRRFKEMFMLAERDQKLAQLKQNLATIK